MNLELSIKKIFIRVTCYVLLVTFLALPVSAQTEGTIAGQKLENEATDSVREKVRQTIENLTKKPKAVVGTLNQVTDSTLVIKTMDEKTGQVATSSETKYTKYSDGKRSDIKFEDLVLGEFIVAMGFRNGNEIVEAKRVLTYTTSPFEKKQTLMGKVIEFSKNKITLLRAGNNQQWTANVTRKTEVTRQAASGGMKEVKANDIKIGDKIIIAGVLDEKESSMLSARAIYIFPNQNVEKNTSPSKSPLPSAKPSPKPSPTP